MHAGELSVISDVTVCKLLILLLKNNSNFPFRITVLHGYTMAYTDESLLWLRRKKKVMKDCSSALKNVRIRSN